VGKRPSKEFWRASFKEKNRKKNEIFSKKKKNF
jgi:hypothetical protein